MACVSCPEDKVPDLDLSLLKSLEKPCLGILGGV